ncbi:MAG TPA: YvcK family protein [Firmicutes bacterium]|nr:YvcK family protein [Bacillota bacterium]
MQTSRFSDGLRRNRDHFQQPVVKQHKQRNFWWKDNGYRGGRENGLVLTALGGGTGLSTLLRGLKKYTANLAAIVNVADDGGSSGRLRENLDMLPPGDIRNCLVALANTEPLLEKVFQHRFTAGEGLEGHSLGNLFLAALTEEFGFEEAILAASRVLAVRGEVLPVTLDKLTLVAELTDGRVIRGESSIPKAGGTIRRLHLDPAGATIYPAARRAILEAEAVFVGPGSLFTSILANLLVPGVAEALRETKARKVYICNVMTQQGETDGFTAADHLAALYDHIGEAVFDTVLLNTNLNIPRALLEKYAAEGAVPVRPDFNRLQKMGVQVVAADVLSQEELVRHDPEKLARVILADVLSRGEKND